MTNSKSTRRALFTSALAMLMCVAMLIGTTFAWFTDTASTAVNKIQSGKLDVALEMATAWDDDGVPTEWATAEGETLEFKKAADAPVGETVLFWEPGCTYELPELRIVNKGNLALKYKVVITGIKGSAKLNEVIDWTMTLDSEDYVVGSEHSLAAKDGETVDFDVLTIKGHMDENAGNEYQDRTIEGISITVYATQDTVEYDSKDNQYDAKAQYPVYAVADVTVAYKKTTASTTITSGQMVGTTTTPLATATVPVGVLTTSGDTATSIPMALSINEVKTTSSNFEVEVADTHVAKTLEVTMTNLSSDNETPIKVKMYVGKELSDFKLYHNSTLMTATDSEAGVTSDQTYYYDRTTGFVTMATAKFSPFTYLCKKPVGVSTFEEFITALEKAEAGDTIRLDAIINPTTNFTFNKSIIIDMNGYGFVRGKEVSGGYGIKVLPDCDLTMRNGSWTIAEDAGYGKITVENANRIDASNTKNDIVFENVNFINLKPAVTYSQTNNIEEVVKVSMKEGMTVNATFTDCSFKNAKVVFSTFDNGKNNFKAVFEGCTFDNLGNTCAIEDYCNEAYTGTASITVNNCTFNITSTSGVKIVNSAKFGQNVDLIFTNNTVTGTIADSATYTVSSSASVKVHSGTGNWGFKSVTYENNTLTGCTEE